MGSDNAAAKLDLHRRLKEQARRKRYNLIKDVFPETGDYRRELYPKHMEFFRAGATHRERLLLAANRVGKTVAGGSELTYHMTGEYPAWWDGYRFDRPVQCLAAGDTSQTTRDIIQTKLLGGLWGTPEFGTGLLPGDLLGKPTPARGVANLYEEITVEHVSGGTSRLMLRSYDQGRRIFQGTEQDFVWMDEEVPKDVYDEALIRTMTTRGLVIMTFTPLSGLTPLVVDFLEARHQQVQI
jgi:phage terminase large subunit-like protein